MVLGRVDMDAVVGLEKLSEVSFGLYLPRVGQALSTRETTTVLVDRVGARTHPFQKAV